MKLSEDLRALHECGDVGDAVEGCAEAAAKLEGALWNIYFNYCECGGTIEDSAEYADRKLKELELKS